MRGKKIDVDFLSHFISKCAGQNKSSQEEIVKIAKEEINDIDLKIKEVEKLKVIRSKLLDVVSAFDKTIISNKNDAKALSFFKIQNPKICKFICDNVISQTTSIVSLKNEEFSSSDIIFCIKQLLEHKVISRVGEYIIKGDSFDEYSKFVSSEV
jgi:hypothetical protein